MTAVLLLLIASQTELTGKVVSVSDGDTIKALVSGEQITVRLSGIDAPEKRQPFGERSKQALSDLCFGRDVRIETHGTDRYGRTLGTVYVDGMNVNHRMLETGMAWHFKRYDRDPELSMLELDSHESHRGLWADREPVPPWEWRKKR